MYAFILKVISDIMQVVTGMCEVSVMAGGITGFVSCLMCAVPFLIIAVYNKDSKEPINFWSGDTTLKTKVRQVREYNREMASLYKKCAIVFLLTGVGCLFTLEIGIILLCVDCTLGIYLVYRNYKKILSRYS